jgi:hypothetical protein
MSATMQGVTQAQLDEFQKSLAAIFTPAAPIEDPELFSGRLELLDELRLELAVSGTNFVLFGERGVGKTSFWKVLLHDRRVQHHTASASDDFVSIFLRVLNALGRDFTESERTRMSEITASIGPDKVASVGSKSAAGTTETPVAKRSLDLNLVLDRAAESVRDLDAIVIDEFQNIESENVQTQIIEVVKGFADKGVDVKIVIVGVADSGDQLLASREYAQYKTRHFLVRRIPRMSEEEIRDILDRRETRFRVRFDPDVKAGVVRVACGYPSVAHRLALAAARAWAVRALLRQAGPFITSFLRFFHIHVDLSVEKAGVHVEQRDLQLAVRSFVSTFEGEQSEIVASYDQAMSSSRSQEVSALLSELTSSPTARVRGDVLAGKLALELSDLEALVANEASALVERVGDEYRLAVRQLRPFLEARDYLGLQPGAEAGA